MTSSERFVNSTDNSVDLKKRKHDSYLWNVVGHRVSPPLHPEPMGTACSQSDGLHGAISREYKGSAGLLRGKGSGALGASGFGHLCDAQDPLLILYISFPQRYFGFKLCG